MGSIDHVSTNVLGGTAMNDQSFDPSIKQSNNQSYRFCSRAFRSNRLLFCTAGAFVIDPPFPPPPPPLPHEAELDSFLDVFIAPLSPPPPPPPARPLVLCLASADADEAACAPAFPVIPPTPPAMPPATGRRFCLLLLPTPLLSPLLSREERLAGAAAASVVVCLFRSWLA